MSPRQNPEPCQPNLGVAESLEYLIGVLIIRAAYCLGHYTRRKPPYAEPLQTLNSSKLRMPERLP